MFPMIHGILAGTGGIVLDADYATYEAAMTTPPGATWRAAVNQLFIDLKAALGVSALSDAWDIAYFLAAETEQASRLNMVKRSHDCTATDAPTFTASRGVAGNGTSQYLTTNYNPNTQGVRFVLANATVGVYSRTDAANSFYREIGAIGGPSRVSIGCRNETGNVATCVNRNGEMVRAVADSLGFFATSRITNDTVAYQRGASVGSEIGVVPTSVPSRDLYICAWNNVGTAGSFSPRQLTFAFIGRGMTGTEHADVYTAVQAAMVAIGASV